MKGPTSFGAISIYLASSELIKSLSYGEVKKAETINYRTLRPERDGLFCERIFGPTKDYECACGKFRSIRYKNIVCDKCGVEVTEAKVRRYRTGHIELSAPVAHIWYYRIVPSKIALLLDVTPADIQSVLYFEKYIVVDPGETDLQPNQILTDEEYEEYREKYKEAFVAETGAIALKKILKNLDLDLLISQLRGVVESKLKVDKKVLKRLELAEEIRKSGNKPEWMILDVIPVIPPDLRPMVPLDGGRFATSDINDLYRRLINRNNRLKKLKAVNAPDIIIKNEMRMLQDAVDSLFDNSRRSHPVTGTGDRPLKSLSDILKGKQGRFRQNLLGKRVDYSGRSVIIVGPNLKLHQCGLPKLMALELFKPFVMRGLVEQGYAHNIKAAKRMIESEHELVWGILEQVVRKHPVLLNRAPTLHRLGIQAFEPILIEDKAIQLHPLVCHAYNADFDGDQMAVHVPLTPEAQIEAWMLMLSSTNLLNPANGKPIVYPTQDMVLGIYCLTKPASQKPEKLKFFDSIEEVLMAIESKNLSYNSWIKYKYNDEWLETTCGRIIFNEIVPEKLRFINDTLNAKKIESYISKCYEFYGLKETAIFLDNLKSIGFKFSTLFGITIGISDLVVPEEKYEIVEKAEKEVEKAEENARNGLITHEEKYNQVIDYWTSANEKIKKLVENRLKEDQGGFNSLYIMMDSGARGSREQIRQLVGMRGLMAKPSGDIIELAIKSNFKEGLSVLEYFISSHGARKGLADTALKTADAGYLTRKLVDIAQDVVVTMEDCGTVRGVNMSAIKEGDEIIKPLSELILGKATVSNIYDPRNGELIIAANEVIDEKIARRIEESGIETVMIRSVLTCEAFHGVCAKCYGWDLAQRRLVNIGEAVGIIAAESIGQPGTQLTMRTFHIGGTAATQLEESELKLNYDAYIVSLPEKIVEREQDGVKQYVISRKSYIRVRKILQIIDVDNIDDVDPKKIDGKEYLSEKVLFKLKDGSEVKFGRKTVVVVKDRSVLVLEGNIYEYQLKIGSILFVKEGDIVKKGKVIAEFDPYNEVLISEYEGILGYAVEVVDGIEEKNKNILVIYDEEGKELDRFVLVPGTNLAFQEGDRVKPGDLIARRPVGKRRTKDIIGGLPRVTELFESRKPKNVAVIAKVNGTVESIEQKKGKYIVWVKAKNGVLFSHIIPAGKNIYVRIGDKVQAGEALCEGVVSSHDILKVLGTTRVFEFLLSEIQSVYRLQGVDINEKHISVIIRQMLKKVEVVDPGDTEFILGQHVDKLRFYSTNDKIKKAGGQPAKAKPILMGLTKASLFTESFLSAASFQETPRVLSYAALRGAKDKLEGLKENLVIGQLIPAGTGIKYYQNIRILGGGN
jgi:DNA-directed RNA polymerase subunit beta'